MLWFNAAPSVCLLALLLLDALAIYVVFMAATAIALVVTVSNVEVQEARVSHAASVGSVVSMVRAAAVLIGVRDGVDMVRAIARWLVDLIQRPWGRSLR
jgi:CitMHS family citrate-Mg2+:H+ or citrate-Ca2+:H+ symporter